MSSTQAFKAAGAAPTAYHSAPYWDARYTQSLAENKTQFEWYGSLDHWAAILSKHFAPSARLLQLGAGNSPLAADLVQRGHTGDIVNIDISGTVVAHMAHQHSSEGPSPLPGSVTWHVADCTALPNSSPFLDGSFDAVLDKGTLDALLCGGDTVGNVAACRREVQRLLRAPSPGSATVPCFIIITYGDPESRVRWFSDTPEGWDVLVYATPKVPGERHPHFLGPVQVTGSDAWRERTKAWSADDLHFIYVCRRVK